MQFTIKTLRLARQKRINLSHLRASIKIRHTHSCIIKRSRTKRSAVVASKGFDGFYAQIFMSVKRIVLPHIL